MHGESYVRRSPPFLLDWCTYLSKCLLQSLVITWFALDLPASRLSTLRLSVLLFFSMQRLSLHMWRTTTLKNSRNKIKSECSVCSSRITQVIFEKRQILNRIKEASLEFFLLRHIPSFFKQKKVRDYLCIASIKLLPRVRNIAKHPP